MYFCCLTGINILNAVYSTVLFYYFLKVLVLFFLLFVVSPTIAHKGWPLLVLYSLAVLWILYIWQIRTGALKYNK